MNKHNSRKPGPPGASGDGSRAKLDRNIQLRIGEGLRAMYDDVVKEGVPDRFADLLREFERQGGDKGESSEK